MYVLGTHESIVLGAYLESAPPDAVYKWFEEHAPEEPAKSSLFAGMLIPDELEEALLAREERLIHLGLARFSTSRNTLEHLFRVGDEAIQCAVLSNRYLGRLFWIGESFFSDKAHADLITDGPMPCLEAYLCNPSIPRILNAAFRREAPFDTIDDDRWHLCVLFAAENSCLRSEWDGSTTLGDQKDDAITAAWRLLDTLPASERWATTLQRLYKDIRYTHSTRTVDASANVDPEDFQGFTAGLQTANSAFYKDAISKWRGDDEAEHTGWNAFGELRRAVAARAAQETRARADLRSFLREHEDTYTRLGYYAGHGRFGAEEIRAAFERDGERFLEAAVENRSFYRKKNIEGLRALYHLLVHEGDPSKARQRILQRMQALGASLADQEPAQCEFDGDLLKLTEEEYLSHIGRADEAKRVDDETTEVQEVVRQLAALGKAGEEQGRRIETELAFLERVSSGARTARAVLLVIVVLAATALVLISIR